MSKNNNNVLQEKVIPVLQKIAGSRHLVALRDGMSAAVPMIIIGSIFMIIAQFPVQGYQNFMAHTFGSNWATIVQYPTNASFHIMGLIAAAGIAYNLAKSYKVDAFSAMVVAIGAFILTIPLNVDKSGALWVPLKLLDSSGLFIAILVGLFVTDFYVWLVHKHLTIKMPATVPPAVSNSFSSLFPGLLALLVVWIIRLIIEATPMQSIPNIVTFLLQKPLSHLTNTLGGAITIELIICILWFFGIHGANTLSGIIMPILLGAMNENAAAFQAGKPLPNIVTRQFFDNFVRIGGCGATFGLAILIAFFAKSKEYKALGKLVIGPSIFNINEPIIFGMPIVMNYKLIVPFILTPMANIIITYFTMKWGWVAKTMGVMVPWTTPPILSGYLATGHVSGAILQIFEIALDFLIYFAFFKNVDKEALAKEQTIATN